jgi:hypothetical protein
LLPISVTVAGVPWQSSSRETVKQYEQGELLLRTIGVWYDAEDEEGVRKLNLYSPPSGAAALEVEYVYRPTAFDTSNLNAEPDEFPDEFHAALLRYVASQYYETVEDNPELAERNGQKFDLAVSELRRYAVQRGGSTPFQIPIVGWTA